MPPLPFKTPHQRQLALWVLRAFSPALGRDRFIRNQSYSDSDIAGFLHLPADPTDEDIEKIPALLDRMLSDLEKTRLRIGFSPEVRDGLVELCGLLQFSAAEQALFTYFTCLSAEPVLGDTHRLLRQQIAADVPRFFSRILALPRMLMAKALAPSGRLANCGLLSRDLGNPKLLEFCSSTLASELLSHKVDPARILRRFGTHPPPPPLTLADFPHLKASTDLLIPFLKVAMSQHRKGVNILIHGAPGTGKTQLSRIIGMEIGLPVFELATEDEDGDPIRASHRLRALRTTHDMFGDTPMLFVLDEAEDVISASSPKEHSMAKLHKGWFNQTLENNRSPVIWISNCIATLDPAFTRRFDFIMEVPVPPRSQRQRILNNLAGDLISPSLIGRLAESEHLAPAVVARTNEVLRIIETNIPTASRDDAFSHLVTNTLRAQGHPDPLAAIPAIDQGLYDIAHLNTPVDLHQLARQLQSGTGARICLYGPPGTGKTAFGHWLAAEVGRPLHLRRASDLLSPFHGATEQNIARTFEEAARDGAVLLVDEVDSFLQDRTRAQRSWEVSQVNEMLTQIEAFPGILIASTNLMDNLDAASMRRFDMKILFGHLRPGQLLRLLNAHCRHLGLPRPTPADLNLASTIEAATPGDFATVARQHRLQPLKDARSLLDALLMEIGHKTGQLRRIGFH